MPAEPKLPALIRACRRLWPLASAMVSRMLIMSLLSGSASAFAPRAVVSQSLHSGTRSGSAGTRSGSAKALISPELTSVTASTLLAGVGDQLGLVGYGGKSAFSETATGAAGDLNQIVAIAVIFPTVVTLAFFKDNILEAFEPDPYSESELPPGWKQVPSQSRPGQFSYLNTATQERYDKLPPAAKKGLM